MFRRFAVGGSAICNLDIIQSSFVTAQCITRLYSWAEAFKEKQKKFHLLIKRRGVGAPDTELESNSCINGLAFAILCLYPLDVRFVIFYPYTALLVLVFNSLFCTLVC